MLSVSLKKTCLITGAANGLGFEFARLFAGEGYPLVVIDIDDEKLKSAVNILKSEYDVPIIPVTKDLSQIGCASEIFSLLKEKNVEVEVLINNAGFGSYGFFAETNWERLENLIKLTVLTTTHFTKLLLPEMIARKRGRILNVASLAAFQPGPMQAVYFASKAFMLSFSQALSEELRGSGVTLTVICPGMMATGFQKANNNESPNLKWTIGSAEKVAKIGFKSMMHGKAVVIPGFLNKILANVPLFIPGRIKTAIMRRIQDKVRSDYRTGKKGRVFTV